MASKAIRTFLCVLVLVAGFAHAQDSTRPSEPNATLAAEHVARRADELRPSPAQLKWQQIPWLTDLAEGLQVAEREKRPVFLWGSDDEPLERC